MKWKKKRCHGFLWFEFGDGDGDEKRWWYPSLELVRSCTIYVGKWGGFKFWKFRKFNVCNETKDY